MSEPSSSKRLNVTPILLALILVLAGALRLNKISVIEPHFDELWFMELSTGRGSAHERLPMNEVIEESPSLTGLHEAPSILDVPRSLREVVHPPLHPFLLRLWRKVAGESLGMSRALSALLATLCIIPLFDLARRLLTRSVALWACTIFAVAPTLIDSAQETRNYALFTLLSLCAAAEAVRVEKFGVSFPRLCMIAMGVLLSLLTHYLAIIVCIVLATYCLIQLCGKARIPAIGAVVIGVIVFSIIWGSAMLAQRGADSEALQWVADVEPGKTWRAVERIAMIPLRLLLEPAPGVRRFALAGAVLFVLPWLLVRRERGLLLFGLWFTGTVLFIAIIDAARSTQRLEMIRYSLIAAPAECVLIAGLCARAGPRLAHALSAAIVVSLLASLGSANPRMNPSYVTFAKEVAALARHDDAIVFHSSPNLAWQSQLMHLGSSLESAIFPRRIARLTMPANEGLQSALRRSPGVILCQADAQLAPSDILPGTRIESRRFIPFVGVVSRLTWISERDEGR